MKLRWKKHSRYGWKTSGRCRVTLGRFTYRGVLFERALSIEPSLGRSGAENYQAESGIIEYWECDADGRARYGSPCLDSLLNSVDYELSGAPQFTSYLLEQPQGSWFLLGDEEYLKISFSDDREDDNPAWIRLSDGKVFYACHLAKMKLNYTTKRGDWRPDGRTEYANRIITNWTIPVMVWEKL